MHPLPEGKIGLGLEGILEEDRAGGQRRYRLLAEQSFPPPLCQSSDGRVTEIARAMLRRKNEDPWVHRRAGGHIFFAILRHLMKV